MKAVNFDLRAYFSRIGFQGVASADFATLKSMMRCQLFSVPFENLDVQEGKVVSLVPEEICAKIVDRKRGGYCYEVNGLFAMALEALGIQYRFVAARPMTYAVRRPRTHLAIVAGIGEEQWLCDLGFGSYGIREPIDLDWLDREIRQNPAVFRLSRNAEEVYVLQRLAAATWKNLYEFTLSPQEWVDFEPANYFNSTHPDSVFVRSLLVVRQTPTGKCVLHGSRFKVESADGIEERIVVPEDLPALLSREFGLRLQV
ncbi:MAG: arylamine N-acetyltransferase [Chlorobium sp.]|jgi:N-hydroxyarylamine O-acetyltransferase|uniref:arylamine N-acetyltransferase family protein n=1 Tax=Chlorobium sp. TaxID=1095 RepID=UPI001D6EDB14|nr:arylamine N-acetyltransferase [Chlorobium sp.]MBN1279660.1 arylamine N-acetyltransferase [Chlorobiaceae bacterium]MCF8216263.1 arylamine N-acetyltransferase [Chlorobium sp.]MCF8271165.1 arylamine N-acetyltransferase [Chlorobium sp.]MCF8287571.1 arylamine N-acetyltransferase [Chlorobium sp.]MCF8291078.1 arylamine N-acetyltransferase [Chlorobium sp.]